jgi:hypothetical protein
LEDALALSLLMKWKIAGYKFFFKYFGDILIDIAYPSKFVLRSEGYVMEANQKSINMNF